jgi:hypothetical protein
MKQFEDLDLSNFAEGFLHRGSARGDAFLYNVPRGDGESIRIKSRLLGRKPKWNYMITGKNGFGWRGDEETPEGALRAALREAPADALAHLST